MRATWSTDSPLTVGFAAVVACARCDIGRWERGLSRFLLALSCSFVFGTVYAAQWARTYGGAGNDIAFSVEATVDGGYVLAGQTYSFGTPPSVWVLKVDTNGNVIWQKTYGGTAVGDANSAQPTADGGYVVAGMIFGAGGDDALVLKLDANGEVIWQKSYGSGHAHSVHPTADGGYVVGGSTGSSPGAWVLKLDASGNIIWQKTYGGAGHEYSSSVVPTADGGYIAAASTSSFGAGGDDVWVLKLDANGAIAGCANVGTSGATPANITVTPVNGTAPVASTNVTPASVTAFASNSFAVSQQQCSSAAAASNIPTLSEWALIVMSGVVGMCGAVLVRRDRKAWRGRA